MLEYNEYLSDYEWVPAKFSGQPFLNNPDLVVIHSGAFGEGVAEYFANPGDNRKASAHFCWSKERDCFVQQVSLRNEAMHAGGSKFAGDRRRVNLRSIGIELPGPWNQNPRSNNQRELLRNLLDDLKYEIPSLKYLTGHQFIDPTNRKDPGPGVDVSWFEGLGYTVAWYDCRQSINNRSKETSSKNTLYTEGSEEVCDSSDSEDYYKY